MKKRSDVIPEQIMEAIAAAQGLPSASGLKINKDFCPVSAEIKRAQAKAAEIKIGAKTADGFVYIGISPYTKRPLYAACEDVPFWQDFAGASRAAKGQGRTCRLPTVKELQLMFNQRAMLGHFFDSVNGLAYWSSTASLGVFAKCIDFADGSVRRVAKGVAMPVRLVHD